jgi:hypothetical protein
MDEDFFIGLNNGLSKLLDGISLFINSMGGMKGVLSGLSLMLISIFKNDLA